MVGGRPMKIEVVDRSLDAEYMLDRLQDKFTLKEIAEKINSSESFLYKLYFNPIGKPTYKKLKLFYDETFGAV